MIHQGQKFLSTPAPHRVTSPWYCLMLGFDQPAKLAQSEKEGLLSQWAYHSWVPPTLVQADLLPKMFCHWQALAQIPGVFPLALMRAIMSVTNWQLLAASWPDQEQPDEGLVSMSIQTMPQRLPGMAAIISSTWAVALLPLHGNMQISVIMPAALAFWSPCTAWESTPPQEQYPRRMAKTNPLDFMH